MFVGNDVGLKNDIEREGSGINTYLTYLFSLVIETEFIWEL